jgi:hypothetical protein
MRNSQILRMYRTGVAKAPRYIRRSVTADRDTNERRPVHSQAAAVAPSRVSSVTVLGLAEMFRPDPDRLGTCRITAASPGLLWTQMPP